METDPLEIDDDNVPTNNELVEPKIQAKCNQPSPIVYTTKLDDMKIFTWNFDLLTSDIISSCIIEESKPKIMQLSKYPHRKSDTSFQNMVQSLNKMNSNVIGNKKTFLPRVPRRRTIQNNADISEITARKQRRIINSQFETETTTENVTYIKTEPLEICNKERDCENNEVVKRRLEFYTGLNTETIDMEICTKDEPLEVSTLESNCEIIQRRMAMKRKIVELNPQSTTETAADEECYPQTRSETSIYNAVCVKAEPVEDCNTLNSEINEHKPAFRTKTAGDDLMRKRNKNLLKMCKPVSVVLDDIGPSIRGTPSNNYKCNSIRGKSNDISESRVTVESKDKTINLGFPLLNLNTYWKSQYFLYYNEFSSELDIYYINENGLVTDYYRLDGDKTILSRTVLLPYIGTEDAVMLTCCCWHQRDQTIRSMWPGLLGYSASRFLKKAHSCPPDNCICCCQNRNAYSRLCSSSTDKKTTTCDNVIVKPVSSVITPLSKTALPSMEVDPISTDDYVIQDLERKKSSTIAQIQEQLENNVAVKHNNVWLCQLLVTNSDTRNLINKALRYTRETPENGPTVEKTCMETSDAPKLIKIITKNKSGAEWYELSKNGEVLAYTARNGFPFSKHTSVSEICCWVSREQLIAKLFKLDADTERNKYSGVKFISKPHFCLPGNCKCCCKNKDEHIERDVSISDITLPKRTLITKSDTVKQPNKVHTTNNISFTKRDVSASDITLPKRTLITKSATVKQPNKVHTTNNISFTQTVKILPKPTAATENQGVVNSLITTILDTFKDVRLTITEDGKVAAALKKPVNTLSTAELNVLSNIISHAQEQVKLLGLRPGANLNDHIKFSTAASQTMINHKQSASNTSPVTTNIVSAHLGTPNPANRNSSVRSHIKSNEITNKNSEQELLTNTLAMTNPSKSNNLLTMTTNSYYLPLSKLYSEKKQNYIYSYISYAQSYIKPTEAVIPRIENVFSLQNENSNSSNYGNDLFALRAAWKNYSTNVTKSAVNKEGVDVHHRSVQKETSTQTKIRVVSPSKLGCTNNPAILNTFNALTNNAMQIQIKPIDPDPIMMPGHVILKASTVDTERNQIPLRTISGGLIELVPLTTQAKSNFLSLPSLVLNTGDISIHQVTEVDPEEMDIPEFRITKPTSLQVNSAPIESVPVFTMSQPSQSRIKDDKSMKHMSEKSSNDVTLTPENLNVTLEHFINNKIYQVLNSAGTEVNTIRLQEKKASLKVNQRSKDIPIKKKTGPKKTRKEMKPLMKSALATLRTYSRTMLPKASSIQNDEHTEGEVPITISNSEIEEDKIEDPLWDVNDFDDVGDDENHDQDANENNGGNDDNDVCILGI